MGYVHRRSFLIAAGALPAARVAASLSLCAAGSVAAAPGVSIERGNGTFTFIDEKGDPSRRMTVFTYLPRRSEANTAQILFVLHGHHKTAQHYRDDWASHADQYGFMVVAPLFDREQWSDREYAYPRAVEDKHGDSSRWSYSVIEHLFDAIKAATGNKSSRYLLYGFSEGGQFVHRLVLLLPEARYSRAAAGSPGWYTMPTFDATFPYGLSKTPVTGSSLRQSLERDFVLLLGGGDTDPEDPEIRKTREALAQGANRVARGQNFYKEAENRAAELKAKFAWRLQIVPGAGHEPTKVSPMAAAVLTGA
jgi:poly(3-hydroxybutyrate) depolymerase